MEIMSKVIEYPLNLPTLISEENAVVITRNLRDFQGVFSLKCENWVD